MNKEIQLEASVHMVMKNISIVMWLAEIMVLMVRFFYYIFFISGKKIVLITEPSSDVFAKNH